MRFAGILLNLILVASPARGQSSLPHEAIHPRDRHFTPKELQARLESGHVDDTMLRDLIKRIATDGKQLESLANLFGKMAQNVPPDKLPIDLQNLDPKLRSFAERLARNPDFQQRVLNNPELRKLAEQFRDRLPPAARQMLEKGSLGNFGAGQGPLNPGPSERSAGGTDLSQRDGSAPPDNPNSTNASMESQPATQRPDQPGESKSPSTFGDLTRRWLDRLRGESTEQTPAATGAAETTGNPTGLRQQATDSVRRFSRFIQEMGGPIAESSTVRRVLHGFGGGAGPTATGSDGSSGSSGRWFNWMQQWGPQTEGLRNWGGTLSREVQARLPGLPRIAVPAMRAPRIALPHVAMPHIGLPTLVAPGAGGWSASGGLARGGAVIAGCLLLAALGFWLASKPSAASRLRRRRKLPRNLNEREMVCWLFEDLALQRLGRSAETAHHRSIAQRLNQDAPGAAGAADRLANLYESARYRPPADPLPSNALAAVKEEVQRLGLTSAR